MHFPAADRTEEAFDVGNLSVSALECLNLEILLEFKVNALLKESSLPIAASARAKQP